MELLDVLVWNYPHMPDFLHHQTQLHIIQTGIRTSDNLIYTATYVPGPKVSNLLVILTKYGIQV
jgi:hypothetical protein